MSFVSYLFLSSSASFSLIVMPIFLKAEMISFKHNLPKEKKKEDNKSSKFDCPSISPTFQNIIGDTMQGTTFIIRNTHGEGVKLCHNVLEPVNTYHLCSNRSRRKRNAVVFRAAANSSQTRLCSNPQTWSRLIYSGIPGNKREGR